MGGLYSSPEGAAAVERRHRELLERWPVPYEQVRVPTAQGETFAVTCGPAGAPPLLLLHGSAGTSAMWLGDVATWARRFRVHAVDIVGEPGLSAPSRPPLRPGTYAGWLGEVMSGLGAERVSIAAVSLGGWMALAYATRWPERVERLALMCPSGIGRRRVLPLSRALPLLVLGGEAGRRRAMRLILGPQAAALDSTDSTGSTGSSGDLAAFALLIHRHYRPRRGRLPVFPDDDLRRLTMPMLVIAGDRDALLDTRATRRRLARTTPTADVRVLPGTGHLLPPQTREIMSFLESTHA
ncbi:alpha/beta hydrolase [Nonomuraea sp. PA05]|uniref:alpha/beta fold hydrolase n=1 Tax=Nonomuraea sp. PA05 TaxID=2604466 RepID=UPI0011D97594|nr:alpha/beta hydrolase [Nonomuraea sp. PA05]TYB60259.1 alpha/beta hydrolase [Nonomuraea sp. PA05]